MVKVEDILRWLDAYAPFRYAESWDNCGLLVGDPRASVGRVLVALDPSFVNVMEADQLGCQCLVSHHPLIHHPLTTVRVDEFPGKIVAGAIRAGINLIAVHTNLDAASGGTNDELVRLLSLQSVEPLMADPEWTQEAHYGGMGRICLVSEPVDLETLAQRARMALGEIAVRVVGDGKRLVHRVAVCTGSGASLIEKVIQSGSDAYITGDIKYHDAQRAMEAGLALIDVGHFASEQIIVHPLASYIRSIALQEHFPLEVFAASEEQDPFWISR